MKFAFNSFAFSSFPCLLPTFSLEETIRFLGEIGYDGVEIGCCAPHAWPDYLTRSDRQRLRSVADEVGIEICSLLPAIGGGPGCNPASINARERQATVAHYHDIIDLAHDLGAGKVLFIAGWLAEGLDRETGWQWSLDCLRDIAVYAAARGIDIALEPTSEDTNLVDDSADGLAMIGQCGLSNVGLMLDTIHVDYSHESFAECISAMGNKLVHLHAADTGRRAIGAGDMDWPAFLALLRDANYDGYFTVEGGFISRDVDPRDVAIQSLDCLKRLVLVS
jgi:fructoselysine 3-epimerase